MIFQFKSLKSAAVTAVNNGTAGTPTGAAHDEESDVMTTMEKLEAEAKDVSCLLYTSPSPRDVHKSRMPSSA